MDVVDTACGLCEGCLRRSIAELEGVIPGQQLHILGERLATASIIQGCSLTVGMYSYSLENHNWVAVDILLLLHARTAISDAEGIVDRQQLHCRGSRSVSEGVSTVGVILGGTRTVTISPRRVENTAQYDAKLSLTKQMLSDWLSSKVLFHCKIRLTGAGGKFPTCAIHVSPYCKLISD